MRKLTVALVVLAVGAGGCKGGNVESGLAGTKSNAVSDSSAASNASAPVSQPTLSRQDIQIAGKGFSQLPADIIGHSYISYAVVVANPNSASAPHPPVATGVHVNVTFKNAAGTVVKSASDTIPYVLPGQTMATGDSTEGNDAASMEVTALVDRWVPNEAPITGTFSASQVSTTIGQFDDMTTSGLETSTFAKDYKDLRGVAVYRNAAGAIIGGAYTYLDFVPGGGNVSFEIKEFHAVRGVANTDVYVGMSNLSL